MSMLLLALAAGSLEPAYQRIEEFRQDLSPAAIEAAEVDRTRALASEAYLWGVPAFLHFRQATEIKQSRKLIAPEEEPFGGWVLLRQLATPQTDNALPNVDTLYGANYVHLAKQGPVILEIPAISGRYFSVTLLDAYFNNFEIVGSRNLAGKPGRFLIVPPGWKGTVPAGINRTITAPTPMIALYQRIYVSGAEEFPLVRGLQDRIRVTPVAGGAFARIETPEFDVSSPVRQTRDPVDFFRIVNSYTGWNPPTAQYAALMASFGAVGLGPGVSLPADDARRAALREGARLAQRTIDADITTGPFRNGWRVPDPRGARPGPYTLPQAVLQLSQIGSLPVDEAVYYVGRRDAADTLLSGQHDYTLTFAAGGLPPVSPEGFWSVTMYKASDLLLVDNPINRYVIRPSTAGLTPGADGSLTIHIAHKRPRGVPSGNWLPAPPDGFVLAIRAYLPTAPILEGRWFPPAPVKKPAPRR